MPPRFVRIIYKTIRRHDDAEVDAVLYLDPSRVVAVVGDYSDEPGCTIYLDTEHTYGDDGSIWCATGADTVAKQIEDWYKQLNDGD